MRYAICVLRYMLLCVLPALLRVCFQNCRVPSSLVLFGKIRNDGCKRVKIRYASGMPHQCLTSAPSARPATVSTAIARLSCTAKVTGRDHGTSAVAFDHGIGGNYLTQQQFPGSVGAARQISTAQDTRLNTHQVDQRRSGHDLMQINCMKSKVSTYHSKYGL